MFSQLRTCIGAIENIEEGQTPIRALINSIVGAVAVVDLQVARNLQRERIESLPNPSFSDMTQDTDAVNDKEVTLTLDGFFENISKVTTYKPDGSIGKQYKNPTDFQNPMTAYAGGKVVFTHSSSRYWSWIDTSGYSHSLGTGASCYCTVPSSASGSGVLCVIIGNGYVDYFSLSISSTTGWCKSIASFALGA